MSLLAALILLTAPVEPTDVVYNAYDAQQAIHDAAEQYGVSEARLTRVVACESRMDPYAVGDRGRSLGLVQLNTLRTGLYWHFLELGYDDAFNPYQAAPYLARVHAGEFYAEGIGPWRWSCK